MARLPWHGWHGTTHMSGTAGTINIGTNFRFDTARHALARHANMPNGTARLWHGMAEKRE